MIKLCLFLLMAVLLLPVASFAGYIGWWYHLPEDSGEVYYAFNTQYGGDTVADLSGNDNYGTLGDTEVVWKYGRHDYGVYMDGHQDTGIELNAALPSNPAELTIETWLKVDNTNKRLDIVNAGAYIYLYRTSSNKLEAFIFDGGNRYVYGNRVILPEHGWVHVALVYDGTQTTRTLKLYVNGKLDGSASYTGGNGYCGYSGQMVVLGTNTSGYANRGFVGWLDEVRISYTTYDFASMDKLLPDGSGEFQYRFDEDWDDTTIIRDASGNDNYGTIEDTTAVTREYGKYGYAVYFDQTQDTGIVISDGIDTHPTTLSVEAWVKVDDSGHNLDIVSSGGYIYLRRKSDNTIEGLLFENANRYLYSTRQILPAHGWTHVAMVGEVDGANGSAALYINGHLEDETSWSNGAGYFGYNGGQIMIGVNTWDKSVYTWAQNREFKGWIDELRIAEYVVDYDPMDVNELPDATGEVLYHFDETDGDTIAQDSSGNNNDGGIYDSGSTNFDSGMYGNALYFDAVSDDSGTIVQMQDSLPAGPCKLTLECWIKPEKSQKLDLFWQGGYIYLKINSSGKLEGLIFDSANRYVYGNTTFSTSMGWTHIRMTYDGTGSTREMALYVNGNLDGSATYTGGSGCIGGGPYTMYIGGNHIGYSWANGYRFKGYMDDVRISYGLYDGGCDEGTGDVLYYFDETSGDTAYDSSGNGYDGTIVDGGTTEWGEGLFGNALYFDGATAGTRVEINDTFPAGPSAFTLEAWIKLEKKLRNEIFWAYDDVGTEEGDTGCALIFLWVNNYNQLQGQFLDLALRGDTVTENRYAYGRSYISLNEWTHVAMTYDGTGDTAILKLFVNGHLDAYTEWDNTGDTPSVPQCGPYKFILGNDKFEDYYSGSAWWQYWDFKGYMDEARITFGEAREFEPVNLDAAGDSVMKTTVVTSLGDWCNEIFSDEYYDEFDIAWGDNGIYRILDRYQAIGNIPRMYWRTCGASIVGYDTTLDEDNDGVDDLILGGQYAKNTPTWKASEPGCFIAEDNSSSAGRHLRLLDSTVSTAMPVTYEIRMRVDDLDGNAGDWNVILRYCDGSNKYWDLCIDGDGKIRNNANTSYCYLDSSTDTEDFHYFRFVCNNSSDVKVYIDQNDTNYNPIASGDTCITLNYATYPVGINYFSIFTRSTSTPTIYVDSCMVDTGAHTPPAKYPYEDWGRLCSDYGADTEWYQVAWSDDWQNVATYPFTMSDTTGDLGRRFDYKAAYEQEPEIFGGAGEDALSAAIRAGQSAGVEMFAWFSICEENHFGNGPMSRFVTLYPEYREVDESGDTWQARLAFSHPEVRAYKLSCIKEVVEDYGAQGILLDFMRRGLQEPYGSPLERPVCDSNGVSIFGYDDVSCEAYEAAYGTDPRSGGFDNGTDSWIEWRCDYWTQFLQDIHDSYPNLPVVVLVFDDGFDTLRKRDLVDMEEWLASGLVDGVAFLIDNSDDGYPYINPFGEKPIPLSSVETIISARKADVNGRADVIAAVYTYEINLDELEQITDYAYQGGADELMWWESPGIETVGAYRSDRGWEKVGELSIKYGKQR